MNEKEIAEIRRRFRPDRSNISLIRGCCVNGEKEIVSEFQQSLHVMPQQESEEMLGILKKTLSGTVGKNLHDVEFATQQVTQGEEHKLLMALRDSSLQDDAAVKAFFQRVAQSLRLDGSYLILLACEKYDVPGGRGNWKEDSSEVFSYFLCSVCPVKPTRPALGYYASENAFHNIAANLMVSPPELGFLFPAFDDRSANIYNALYYTRSADENHGDFVDAVFKAEIPMPAAEQKETFRTILNDSVAEDCNLDVVQAVQSRFSELIDEHKANKEAEPPAVSKKTVSEVLENCGVPKERVNAFERKYDDEFGADTEISPQNLIDPRQMEVRTPDVSIRVDPAHGDAVETRVIDGVKYLLIRADAGVEVNGVNISIS